MSVGSIIVAGVGFSNLKNCRTRIQKFGNRSELQSWINYNC